MRLFEQHVYLHLQVHMFSSHVIFKLGKAPKAPG